MSRKSPSSRRIRRRKCGRSSIPDTVFLKKTGLSSTPSISSGTTHIVRPASWNLCSSRVSALVMEKTGCCGRRKSSSPRDELKKICPVFYSAQCVRDGPPRRGCPTLRRQFRRATNRCAALSPDQHRVPPPFSRPLREGGDFDFLRNLQVLRDHPRRRIRDVRLSPMVRSVEISRRAS